MYPSMEELASRACSWLKKNKLKTTTLSIALVSIGFFSLNLVEVTFFQSLFTNTEFSQNNYTDGDIITGDKVTKVDRNYAPQTMINSASGIQVQGDVYGDIIANTSTELGPKLRYKELYTTQEDDNLYHTTYGLIVSFVDADEFEELLIIDLNPMLKCGELNKAHFGIWAGFPDPGWILEHKCVSVTPVEDDGELFKIVFKKDI